MNKPFILAHKFVACSAHACRSGVQRIRSLKLTVYGDFACIKVLMLRAIFNLLWLLIWFIASLYSLIITWRFVRDETDELVTISSRYFCPIINFFRAPLVTLGLMNLLSRWSNMAFFNYKNSEDRECHHILPIMNLCRLSSMSGMLMRSCSYEQNCGFIIRCRWLNRFLWVSNQLL